MEQDALDDLKGELLHQLSLYIPDYNLGFILDTDASDVGMGAVLFQIKDGKRRIVAFYSASFDLSMQARPVYYKEARVIFWSLGKARYIISCSPIQTRVRSDHAPLRWIKNSLKGPVSAWRIDEASDLDYRVEYIKGPDNIIGDAFSRPPFVRPTEILIQSVRKIAGNITGDRKGWTVGLGVQEHSSNRPCDSTVAFTEKCFTYDFGEDFLNEPKLAIGFGSTQAWERPCCV